MNSKTTPKDFFLHLGAVIALYSSAIALLNLAFSISDKLLPDSLDYYSGNSAFIWPVSMLIVLIPVLYVLEYLITRDIRKMAEKADIWVRRWRIYLTLFLAGATIVGDLIALIYTFLSGEIASRFILKVAIVFIVAAVIFTYYLLSYLHPEKHIVGWKRIIFWLGLVIVVGPIVGAFFIIGSPATQRALAFDQTRINDLNNIQYAVENFSSNNGVLPVTLEKLAEKSYASIPTDPETRATYEYRLTSDGYELCATFDLSSGQALNSQMTRPVIKADQSFSNYTSGRNCFQRQFIAKNINNK